MRYLIHHETSLSFPRPVREHQCELRLVPRDDERQRVLRADIDVHPPCHLGGYLDCFGNRVSTTSLVTPHDGLRVTLEAEVETRLANPFDYLPVDASAEPAWIEAALRREPRFLDFVLHRSASVPLLSALPETPAVPARDPRKSVLETLQEAMEWAKATYRYEPGATDVHAPLATFFEKGAGVCQDFAHLLVAVARSHGIPARYAMGYLDPGYAEEDDDAEPGKTPEAEKSPEPAKSPEGAKSPAPAKAQSQSQAQSQAAKAAPPESADAAEDDSAATHAWAEVLIPGAGWRGFDATQQLVVNDTYVTVAVGRDSRDAAPLRGSFKGDDGGELPRVRLRVSRQQQQ